MSDEWEVPTSKKYFWSFWKIEKQVLEELFIFQMTSPVFGVTWRFIHPLALWKETTNFASFTCPDGRGRVAENFCFFRVRVQRQAESSRGVRKRKHGKRGTPSATPPYHYMEELLSPHITRRESIKQPRSMHPKKNTWREKKPQKAF